MLSVAGLILISIYIYSMFIYPFYANDLDWKEVQKVWHSWQSLNVGVLAFSSSLIALNISRYNSYKLRNRQFIAAKAFLPGSLSELSTYCKPCSALVTEAWGNLSEPQGYKVALDSPMPELPSEYKEVFSKCIELADPEIGDYLALILRKLQIQNSRLVSFHEKFSPDSSHVVGKSDVIGQAYDVAELQYIINKVFTFSRNSEKFARPQPSVGDFSNIFFILNFPWDEMDGLTAYAEESIKTLLAEI